MPTSRQSESATASWGITPTMQHGLATFIISGSLLWLFGGALWRDEVFTFRDAGLFYYPLFQWIVREWGAGRIPLWNPCEGWGTPVVADATSSVFYPPKLLFVLPFSFSRLFVAYTVLHLLGCAAGMYWLTRVWKASIPAATVAAVSYAFGGSILFQYTNLVFLVGAAWLPWGVLFLWQLLTRPTLSAMLGLSAVLVMIVLGGDPQLVVHLAFVTGIGWWILLGRQRWNWRGRKALLAAGGAFLFAFGLAAIQILPSAAVMPHTSRAVYEFPRTIYEACSMPHDALQGIFGEPVPETQHAKLYEFSLGPWRWCELVVPNIGGTMFPRHQRWFSSLVMEGGVWSPSLYMGLGPLLWGASQFRWRRGRRRARWLTWIATFFALGSLGLYGGGWMVKEIARGLFHADTTTWLIGEPTGGLYWFLVVAVPGYVQFRYPAKLWTLVAFAIACLAAKGFDHWRQSKARPAVREKVMVIIAWVIAGVSLVVVPWMMARYPFPADDLLGPFQAEGASWDVIAGLLHCATVMMALWWLAYCRSWSKSKDDSRTVREWGCVILVAGELLLANQWQINTIPASDLQQVSPSIAKSQTSQIRRFDPGNWRHDFPPQFATESSSNRLQEGLRYDRARGYGRWHLLDEVGSLRPYTTLVSADYEIWQQIGGELNWPERVRVGTSEMVCDVSDPAIERKLSARKSRLSMIRDELSMVRDKMNQKKTDMLEKTSPAVPPQIELLAEAGNQLHLRCIASQSVRLVANVSYDPGWHAEIISRDGTRRSLPIQQANQMMLSVAVPAGEHQIHFTYWPREFTWGAILSGLCWFAWGAMVLTQFRGLYFFKIPRN